jgi:hypothetical protein
VLEGVALSDAFAGGQNVVAEVADQVAAGEALSAIRSTLVVVTDGAKSWF